MGGPTNFKLAGPDLGEVLVAMASGPHQ